MANGDLSGRILADHVYMRGWAKSDPTKFLFTERVIANLWSVYPGGQCRRRVLPGFRCRRLRFWWDLLELHSDQNFREVREPPAGRRVLKLATRLVRPSAGLSTRSLPAGGVPAVLSWPLASVAPAENNQPWTALRPLGMCRRCFLCCLRLKSRDEGVNVARVLLRVRQRATSCLPSGFPG